MNAHAVIDSDKAGRRPLDAEILAVQQKAVLRYLGANPGQASIGELSAALDRDPSNLRKTLDGLQREGLCTPKPYSLTDHGRAWLPRLAALEGAPAASGLPPLTWAQIRPNPENPRKVFAFSPLEALAESIARKGVKTPLLLKLDADGQGGELDDGERRYRAIELLITRGDPRWPADRPVPYTVNLSEDAADRMADALVTSIHKENLDALEEAEAFAWLKAKGWSTARILEETGFERRNYELRLDLLNLSEKQRERMRLDKDDQNYLSVKGARGLLQHLRTINTLADAGPEASKQTDLEARTLDLTDKLALALTEVAFAIEQRPGREPLIIANEPSGGALPGLMMKGLVEYTRSLSGFALSLPKGGAAIKWLSDEGFYDDPAAAVFTYRAAVLGSHRAKHLAESKAYATEELNHLLRPASPNAVTPMPAPPAAPIAPQTFTLEVLSGRERMILFELAHKIFTEPVKPHPLPCGATRVGAYWLDGRLDVLVQERRLIAFANPGDDNGWLGYVTPEGWKLLGSSRQRVTPEELEKVRGEAAQANWPGPGYATDWLNVEPITPSALDQPALDDDTPPPADGDADGLDPDEQERVWAAQALATVDAGIAAAYEAVDFEGYEGAKGFRDLLIAVGFTGPVYAEADGGLATLPQESLVHFALVDVNNEMPDDLVHARAKVIAFALNTFAGFKLEG